MRVAAVIPAAGQGRRMKTKVNKQYMVLFDRPVLAHTIRVFEECALINEIILVVGVYEQELCRKEVVEKYGFAKVKKIVAGGEERQFSVWNGLQAVEPGTDLVVIHDGARPLVTTEIIVNACQQAHEFGAAAAGVRVKDTVKLADSEEFIVATLERRTLWAIQTPQAFHYDLIIRAHRRALDDGFLGTDDAVLVERLGCAVKLVEGSYENIKITTPEDLLLAEAILRREGRCSG